MNRSDPAKEFMNGPLVKWFTSVCDFPEELLFEDVIDGYLMHSVFLKTYVHESTTGIVPSHGDPTIRLRNLTKVLANLKHYYELAQDQVVIVKLPDVQRLAKEPRAQVPEAKLMLVLLLGCAFSCRNNAFFINKIGTLDENNQRAIAEFIKTTKKPDILLSLEMLKLSENAETIFELVRRINTERNLIKDELNSLNNIKSNNSNNGKFYLEVQKLKDEIDENNDELKKTRSTVQQLQKENNVLKSEMRSLKHFQDEIDAVHESAIKVDRLEQQISRYQDKMEEFNLYKTQVQELQRKNIELIESSEIAIEQTNKYKSSLKMKSLKVNDLEKTVRQMEQDIDVANAEKDEYCDKYHKLSLEHCKLISQMKAYRKVLTERNLESDKLASEELLMSSSQIRLEQENRALLAEVETCRKKLSHVLEQHKQELQKITLLYETLSQTCKKAVDGEKKLVKDKEELKKMVDSAKNDKQAERKFLQQKVNQLNEKIEQLENDHNFKSRAAFECEPLWQNKQENMKRTWSDKNRLDDEKPLQPVNQVSMKPKKQQNINQFHSKHKVYLKPRNQQESNEKKQNQPLQCSTNQKPNEKLKQNNKSTGVLKKLNYNKKFRIAQTFPAAQQKQTDSRSLLMTENLVPQVKKISQKNKSKRQTETTATSRNLNE